MSRDAVSFYLAKHLDTGCLGFYYDFDHWSGTHILNAGSEEFPAYTRYSGSVVGDFNNFTGHASGKGSFSNSYIKVENADTQDGELLREGGAKGFSFLISQEKVDNSCGTLFSNYAGLQPSSSGWEIGINNANLLYFKFQDAAADGTPTNNIKTVLEVPAAKNWYGISIQDSTLELTHFNPLGNSISTKRINSNYIRNNSDWYIGTGEYPYSGYIDNFFAFNTYLSPPTLGDIVTASYQEIVTGVGSELFTISSDITGYSFYATGATGIVGSTGTLSGYNYTTGSGTYITGSGLTGAVNEGEIYYEAYTGFSGAANPFHPESGTLFSGVTASSALLSEITGFETGLTGYGVVTQQPVYSGSGISGVLWSGSGYEPSYGYDQTIYRSVGETLLSGERFETSGVYDCSYLKNTLSYLEQRGSAFNTGDGKIGDFVEIIGNIEDPVTNIRAAYGYSRQVYRDSFYIDKAYKGKPFLLNVFANGVYQITGGLVDVPLNNPRNPLATRVSVEGGNYALKASTLVTPPGGWQFGGEEEIYYDAEQNGSRGRRDVTNVAEYSIPFPEIPANDSQVFFNGQKIYSGIDYIAVPGFQAIGEITNMTGTFAARPAYGGSGVTTYSGINLYDLTGVINNRDCPGFSGENFIYYVNGVRGLPWGGTSSAASFIAYSTGVSLLKTGRNVMELPQETFYNITTINKFF
jgi:hypothetical protein